MVIARTSQPASAGLPLFAITCLILGVYRVHLANATTLTSMPSVMCSDMSVSCEVHIVRPVSYVTTGFVRALLTLLVKGRSLQAYRFSFSPAGLLDGSVFRLSNICLSLLSLLEQCFAVT